MEKEVQMRRFSIGLPVVVYDQLKKLAKEKLTSLSVEAAKAIVDRLKEHKLLEDDGKKYL